MTVDARGALGRYLVNSWHSSWGASWADRATIRRMSRCLIEVRMDHGPLQVREIGMIVAVALFSVRSILEKAAPGMARNTIWLVTSPR